MFRGCSDSAEKEMAVIMTSGTTFANIGQLRFGHGEVITSIVLCEVAITHPCPNFNWNQSWIGNYIPLLNGDVTTYSCPNIHAGLVNPCQ